MTAISPVGSAAADIRMPYPVELEKQKEISPEEKAKKEQEKRQNRFKSALKCGGTAAGAVIAGNVIFFNKSWKGKGNKIPSTVKALYNGLLGGALIGTGYHAGIWDKLPPKQTIGYTLSIEPIKEPEKTSLPDRMKALGILGAASYILTSGLELVSGKFKNTGKILGKNALATAGIMAVTGGAVEGIRYYRDKKSKPVFISCIV